MPQHGDYKRSVGWLPVDRGWHPALGVAAGFLTQIQKMGSIKVMAKQAQKSLKTDNYEDFLDENVL